MKTHNVEGTVLEWTKDISFEDIECEALGVKLCIISCNWEAAVVFIITYNIT